MAKKPQVFVIAGPNGSGKTTFATEFLPGYADCPEFINADEIARGLSRFSPDAVALRAGRILLEQIESYAARKIDFAFETTLSGFLSRAWPAGSKWAGMILPKRLFAGASIGGFKTSSGIISPLLILGCCSIIREALLVLLLRSGLPG